MKNTARKASVQSSAFRRQHAVVHVISAVMHILPGYRGTYIRGGGGGMYFRGIAADSKFQSKMKRYLFSEGYLFTGFYGIQKKKVLRVGKALERCTCEVPSPMQISCVLPST